MPIFFLAISCIAFSYSIFFVTSSDNERISKNKIPSSPPFFLLVLVKFVLVFQLFFKKKETRPAPSQIDYPWLFSSTRVLLFLTSPVSKSGGS